MRELRIDGFPFKSTLSFTGIIGYWELQQYNDDPIISTQAKAIIELVEKQPEIRSSFSNIEEAEPHQDLIKKLVSAVVPPAAVDQQIMALFRPFSMEYFYATPKFHEIVNEAGSLINMAMDVSMEEIAAYKTISAYQAILYQFYGVEETEKERIVLQKTNENGLKDYFHMSFDPRFCEITLKGELPQFKDDDIEDLLRNLDDLPLWMEKLPPSLFEFRGFAIYSLTKATSVEVVSQIKEALLEQGSVLNQAKIEVLESNLRSMLRIPDLKIGISSHHSQENKIQAAKESCRSKLVKEDGVLDERLYDIYKQLKESKGPIVVTDIDRDPRFPITSKELKEKIKSLMLIPLISHDELIGVLEIGSKKAKALNMARLLQLQEILPLFSVALERDREEMRNKIQSTIKENYTSIHPSVEWKFREAAMHILYQQEIGEGVKPDEIVLDNVHPLYAASDIRNSSIIRNEAIAKDLIEQLKLSKKVIQEARKELDYPIFGEIVYRINKSVSKLKRGLLSGDELSIVNFLKDEVEPLILGLEGDINGFKEVTKEYWNALDQEIGIVYNHRKDFERSLTRINDEISLYLERQQEKAQSIFPHYYEVYKTDGVEYNVYLGQSITNEKHFKPIYLRNMRLWQLQTSIEIARMAEDLKTDLPIPLDTTHLVLVHSQPLAVKFKMDEKQFDVDGAYNMRYEIVKKRIDKVHIKDTDERLTKPNTVAIVYSHPEDALEYKSYLEYLRHKGMIGPVIEELDLEDLQGVSGLRALRVKVEMGPSQMEKELEKIGATSKVQK